MFHFVKYFIIVNLIFSLMGVFAILFKKQILNNVKFSLSILRLFLLLSFLIPIFVANLNFDMFQKEIKISENVEFINKDGYEVDNSQIMKQEGVLAQNTYEEVERFNYINLIGMLFIALFALGNIKFILNFYQLRRFLQKSYVLKKYKNIEILTNENCKSPFSTIVRGKLEIVIPQNLYVSKERKVILHHEITHHRNKDTYWTLFEDYVMSAFFINVIFERFRGFVKLLEEINCDLIASAKDVKGYCFSLARVYEELISAQSKQNFVCTNTFVFNSEITKFRIEKLLSEKEKIKMKVLILAIIAFICTSLGVAFGVSKVNSYEKDFDKAILNDVRIVAKEHLKKLNAKSINVAVYDIEKQKVVAGITVRSKKENYTDVFEKDFLLASTIKPFIVAKAFEDGVIKNEQTFDTKNGKIELNGKTYKDWNSRGFGKITAKEILEQSSSIGSILIAEKLKENDLRIFLKSFEINLSENDDIISIGGGFSDASMSLSNLAKGYASLIQGNLIKKESQKIILNDLEGVVLNGTGKSVQSKKYRFGGKTGSVESTTFGDKSGKAIFVGVASIDIPKYIIAIISDVDKSLAHGGSTSGPIFKEIAEKILDRENSKK